MQARLERILIKLAERVERRLLDEWQAIPGDPITRLQWLARRLADVGCVLLIGQLEPPQPGRPRENPDVYIEDWLRGYADLYALLAGELFPTHTHIDATYADDAGYPWVVVAETRVEALSQVLAGMIVPYLAYRQQHPPATIIELRGLMDFVLYEGLAADNLSLRAYHNLLEESVTQLKRMLGTRIRHITATDFDQPVFRPVISQSPPPPSGVPEQTPPGTPPSTPPSAPDSTFKDALDRIESDDSDLTTTSRMFINPALPRKPGSPPRRYGPPPPRRDNGGTQG